jgi:hypothetical protein
MCSLEESNYDVELSAHRRNAIMEARVTHVTSLRFPDQERTSGSARLEPTSLIVKS